MPTPPPPNCRPSAFSRRPVRYNTCASRVPPSPNQIMLLHQCHGLSCRQSQGPPLCTIMVSVHPYPSVIDSCRDSFSHLIIWSPSGNVLMSHCMRSCGVYRVVASYRFGMSPVWTFFAPLYTLSATSELEAGAVAAVAEDRKRRMSGTDPAKKCNFLTLRLKEISGTG